MLKDNLLNKALSLLRKTNTKQSELFSKEQLSSSSKEKKKRRFIFGAFFVGTFGLGYFLGGLNGAGIIKRDGVIYHFKGRTKRVYLQQLNDGNLEVYASRAQASAPFWEFEDSDKIALDGVRRIDLKAPEKEEESYHEITPAEKRFLGRYNVQVSRHKGILTLYRRSNGKVGGVVRFTNWGRRRAEHLYGISINGRKIRFRRFCRGRSCARIGATQAINQKFTGKLSSDRRSITGTYSGGFSGTLWSGQRK